MKKPERQKKADSRDQNPFHLNCGSSMGQSLYRRGTNTKHQAELPSFLPIPLVGLQSALRDFDEEKGKPLPQMPQCKMMVGEEIPETEEIGKDSATCTNWQIGKHNWENK